MVVKKTDARCLPNEWFWQDRETLRWGEVRLMAMIEDVLLVAEKFGSQWHRKRDSGGGDSLRF
jgi:hypothetical protein